MNDFESRARSAARAVRDLAAADDASAAAPTTDTVAVPPRKRHPMRALLAAAAVVVVAAIVGGVIVTTKDDGPTAAEVSAFCDAIRQSGSSTEGARPDREAIIDSAPAEYRDDVRTIFANRNLTRADPATLDAVETSSSHVFAWYETNCFPDAAAPGAPPADQRYGPETLPDGTRPCFVINGPTLSGTTAPITDDLVVYEPATRGVGLLAVSSGNESHVDVEATSVAIPGVEGARKGPVDDLQGRAIDGSAGIEWDGAHSTVGLLARGSATTLDLDALAARVETNGGSAELAPEAVPPGWHVVYRGPAPDRVGSAIGGPQPEASFSVSVVSDGGSLVRPSGLTSTEGFSWSGQPGADSTLDATRLFLPESETRSVNGKRLLTWTDTVNQTERSVARWIEPGGVVITAVAPATQRAQLDRLIAGMRLLDRAQWTGLTKQFNYCGVLSSLGRATAHSETSSGSASSSGTSSTSVVAETPTTTITVPGPVPPAGP